MKVLDYCSFCITIFKRILLSDSFGIQFCLLLIMIFFPVLFEILVCGYSLHPKSFTVGICIALIEDVSFVVHLLTYRFQDHSCNENLSFKPVWGADLSLNFFVQLGTVVCTCVLSYSGAETGGRLEPRSLAGLGNTVRPSSKKKNFS